MIIEHIPRVQNSQADALSKLATSGNLNPQDSVIVLQIPQLSIQQAEESFVLTKDQMDPWYAEMWKFLSREELPDDELAARKVKRLAPRYTIMD